MIEETLYKEMLSEFLTVFRKFAGTDVYSVTLCGSYGKGIADGNSDFDFGIYYEEPAEKSIRRQVYKEVQRLIEKWKAKGIVVDEVWPRAYSEVDEQLEMWLTGKGTPEPFVWTIWGYNPLTAIYNQQIIEDPYGRIARWKERLSVYPKPLKESIINKHASSLTYWRNDYHYRNKVHRKDVVFLASLTTRLIHDMMQVIYAVNEFYYPGDGMNLQYTEQFECKPERFEERIVDVLQVSEDEDGYEVQYKKMTGLMDEVLMLLVEKQSQEIEKAR